MAEGYAKKTNWEEKLMDEVKKLLGDELFKQVEEKIGDVKIDIVSDGKKWIPKVKFDEINTDKNTYKKQAENLTKDLDKLKESLKDNKDATEIIEGLKEEISKKEKEMAEEKKLNAIKLEILKDNPHNVEDILRRINVDEITIKEDGEAIGLRDVLDKIKKDESYLYKDDDGTTGTGGSKGAGQKPPRKDNYETNLGTELGKKSKIKEVDISRYEL